MSALTPVSVKVEDTCAAQAESSTSRRRSARHAPPILDDVVKEELEEEEEEQGVYVVEAIIAKSVSRIAGPWGSEHTYLVRWAGYSAKHDTWEPGSSLAQNAERMIDEFDKIEHPFNITDRIVEIMSPRTKKTLYKVELCGKKGTKAWSPMAETRLWNSSQLRFRKHVSAESLKKAVDSWRISTGDLPADTKSFNLGVKRKHRSESDDEDDSKVASRVRIPGDMKKYSQRVLLQILDEQQYRKNLGPWRSRYRVRHYLKDRLHGYQERDTWYCNRYLILLFGPETMREKLNEYMPEPKIERVKVETLEDGTIVRHDVVSDYEKDRLRRIKENEDLIKELGLVM